MTEIEPDSTTIHQGQASIACALDPGGMNLF